MKVAILGAGFCGLAVAWYLREKCLCDIVVFDPMGIGKGASGVAAGLLHSYAGAQAKKNLRADSGLAATLQLLRVAEVAIDSPVISTKGLIRLAVSEKQKLDFALAASLYSDVYWLNSQECSHKLGYHQPHPGIFIDSGLVIDCEKYLKGLWKACLERGAMLEKKAIRSLAELSHFDHIIVTIGAAVASLPELCAVKITPIKGQVLELNWPQEIPPLAFPISSQAYLLRRAEGQQWIAGATFEREFEWEGADQALANSEIMPKLQAFIPEMNSSLITGCRAGIRASAPRHQPLLLKVNDKSWVLTGMGSKGLLYHALYADELTSLLLARR